MRGFSFERVAMRYQGRRVFLSAKDTIHLQSVGTVPAIAAEKLRVGNVMMWNFGSTSTVETIENASPYFLLVTEKTKEGKLYSRKMKKSRLVAISPMREHWDANPQLADLVLPENAT